jgi:ribosomal protein L7/L12
MKIGETTSTPTSTPASAKSQTSLAGWLVGFQKIPFIRLLKQDAGLGLRDAKHACDDLLLGSAISVTVLAPRSDGFVAEARRLGVKDIDLR